MPFNRLPLTVAAAALALATGADPLLDLDGVARRIEHPFGHFVTETSPNEGVDGFFRVGGRRLDERFLEQPHSACRTEHRP